MKRLLVPSVLFVVSCHSGSGVDAAGDLTGLAAAEASVSTALLKSEAPCDDFYAYACGGWLASTEIPGDQVSWYRSFSTIDQRNEAKLHDLLEKAAVGGSSDRDFAKIGAVYGACMDENRISDLGAAPLTPLLAEVDGIRDLASLMSMIGKIGLIQSAPLFSVMVDADYKNPSMSILYLGQGGLGLPDRDYYLDDSAEAVQRRADYRTAMVQLLSLAGVTNPDSQADQVVAFERELAKIHKPRDQLRDPEQTYHKLDRSGLESLTPRLPWKHYLEASGILDRRDISVEDPEHMKALGELVARSDIGILRSYVRWHTVLSTAQLLPTAFVDAHFEFFGKKLVGQKQQKTRWKKCVDTTAGLYPEIVARYYVKEAFPGDSKAIALDMIQGIETAFQENLPALAWMDDATRARALEKMNAIRNKIGYPDRWRDYATVPADPKKHFENVLEARRFEVIRQFNKVGRPADRDEWFMAASDVNAYYNPTFNEIVFPAGILQRPFFDREYPAPMNYGAIGMIMGHEVTHGFDDSGRKFDGNGVMTEWWAPEVAARFEERSACVVAQYNAYEVLPGVHVNGTLTLGENIADLGGIKQAYAALKAWEAKHGAAPSVAGLNADQLFFVSYAQAWCSKRTPEVDQMYAAVDPHSPPQFRVNGAVSSSPKFAEAFQCKPGAPMNPEKRCEVW